MPHLYKWGMYALGKSIALLHLNKNILIAFENRIRLSVDILILSADTLIVLVNTKAYSSPVLYFSIVTSSRCHN